MKLPGINETAASNEYSDSYNKVVSEYTARLEKILSDPKLKSARTAAQKHAAHILEMKQIVEAQNECAHALKKLKTPADLSKFNYAMQVYFQQICEKSRELEESVKHKDVPDLNMNLHKIDESAENAAENVDRTLAQIPHYEQGKKQVADLWSQLKRKMAEEAPPVSN